MRLVPFFLYALKGISSTFLDPGHPPYLPPVMPEPPSTFLTLELLNDFRNDYEAPSNASQHIARNALTHARFSKVIIDPNRVNALHTTFSDELDITTSTSDQQRSGRCWLFSFLNVLRAHMVKRYELDADFEFSQVYMFFWDQLEKCNWFLHTIWTLIHEDKPYDDPYVRELLKEPLSDGGQWHMIQNLVHKYGVVPRHAMQESHQANNTEQMTTLLSSRLREFAHQFRQRHRRDTNASSSRLDYERAVRPMLYEIYTILCVFLGEPPKTIRWEYNPSEANWAKEQWKRKTQRTRKPGSATRTTAGGVSETTRHKSHHRTTSTSRSSRHTSSRTASSHKRPPSSVYAIDKKPFEESETLTPMAFYRKYVDHKDLAIQDYVTIIHYPHPTRPYHRCYTVKYLNNMKEGPGVRRSKLYNVPIDAFKTITRRSIDAGEPVWFCADVGKDVSGKYGIMDPLAFQFSTIFGDSCVPYGWDKGERMMHKDGVPNHAMVLRGYHVEPPSSLTHSGALEKKADEADEAVSKGVRVASRSSRGTSWGKSRGKNKKRKTLRATKSTATKRTVTKRTPKKTPTHKTVGGGNRRDTPGTPTTTARWLVENSWGSFSGIDGNYVMSDEWFNRHVYEVAVHKRHLKGVWKGTPTTDDDKNDKVLDMWDVFGSLFG